MLKIVAVGVLMLAAGFNARAQNPAQAAPPQRVQVAPPAADLNAIVLQIQRATSSANADIGKLRIEKWKTDSDQKQQLREISDSLQKNIANAVPGLINDVQSSRGGVVATFKLYHNLNVLYEFLSSLADAAGSLGKKDEYEPLAADAGTLDSARQNLSTYIEQAANRLETLARPPATPTPSRQALTPVPGKVVVIDDTAEPAKKPVKRAKKKASALPPSGSTQTANTPH
ncbi:MAG: hypothetical protein WA738_20535 [Candidatus Angelobacter sp.]